MRKLIGFMVAMALVVVCVSCNNEKQEVEDNVALHTSEDKVENSDFKKAMGIVLDEKIRLGMKKSNVIDFFKEEEIEFTEDEYTTDRFHGWRIGNSIISIGNLRIEFYEDNDEMINLSYEIDEELLIASERFMESIINNYGINESYNLEERGDIIECNYKYLTGDYLDKNEENMYMRFRMYGEKLVRITIDKFSYNSNLNIFEGKFNLDLPLAMRDIIYLDKRHLSILRNGYYARRGYIFKSEVAGSSSKMLIGTNLSSRKLIIF